MNTEDTVYFSYRAAQVKAMQTERLGIIHVSDLVKPCNRNIWYDKTTPDIYKTLSTEEMRSLFLGQILHAKTQLSADNEIFFAYDYVEDKSIPYDEAKKIPLDDKKQLDIIYGRADDLINGNIICDKKTTKNLSYYKKVGKPNQTHVEQLNYYRVLLNKCYGIDVKEGCLIYIPVGIQDSESPLIFKFDLEPIQKTLRKMILKAEEIKYSLITGKPPERTRNYLCDGMCKYALRCFSEFKGEQVLSPLEG